MIDVICTNPACPQKDEVFNMAGAHAYVVCGGCHVHLAPTNERPDPLTQETPTE